MIEDHWSQSCDLPLNVPEEEQNEVCPHTSLFIKTPLIPIDGWLFKFQPLEKNHSLDSSICVKLPSQQRK